MCATSLRGRKAATGGCGGSEVMLEVEEALDGSDATCSRRRKALEKCRTSGSRDRTIEYAKKRWEMEKAEACQTKGSG